MNILTAMEDRVAEGVTRYLAARLLALPRRPITSAILSLSKINRTRRRQPRSVENDPDPTFSRRIYYGVVEPDRGAVESDVLGFSGSAIGQQFTG